MKLKHKPYLKVTTTKAIKLIQELAHTIKLRRICHELELPLAPDDVAYRAEIRFKMNELRGYMHPYARSRAREFLVKLSRRI